MIPSKVDGLVDCEPLIAVNSINYWTTFQYSTDSAPSSLSGFGLSSVASNYVSVFFAVWL